ncbi:MAG: TSUP family transporter [Deltaproteobacteria bacterium]|nr:TSUP family transporter [Deltaproteobacteria bacterium]
MDLSFWAIAALCGLVFLAGFVDSIAGGGGLISVPAYLALGLPPHAALATNKFSSVAGTLTATWRYWRARKIHLRTALVAAAGALAGSAAGARTVLLVPAAAVHTVVLVLVPAALVVLLFQDRLLRRAPLADGGGEPGRPLLRAVALGLLIGAWDGFFGPGTGTFLALGFHLALRFDLLTASGNARLVNLASNAGAVVVFLAGGRVVFPLALYAAAAGIAGNQLGSMVALRRGERIIRPFLVVVLVLLLAEVVRRRFA